MAADDHATIPSIARAQQHAERIAIVANDGVFRYADLLEQSAGVASELLASETDLQGARVCFMVPPSAAYVSTLFGIWRAGGVAVPLCVTHPAAELEHVLSDSGATILIAHPSFESVLAPLARSRQLRLLRSTELAGKPMVGSALPVVDRSRAALLIYTSGTTGKPKGALSTHAILEAQMRSIASAWELQDSDRILHVLPLHHLHGILNALLSVLYAAGSCELVPEFDPHTVWTRLRDARELTLFMAVPTIYAKLATHWDTQLEDEQRALTAGCQRLRLMVSGSAALPVSMLERFRRISEHTLLERYGMTEIGMALGNPLHGPRRAGSVGLPFPEVQARIVSDTGEVLSSDSAGGLEIRGPAVFERYWGRPDATREVFTVDGWFKTGDVAVREQDGYYRLLGRESVDILKTGGYKVSALEIEETLREHPAIAEASVVGIPDEEWGERVAALLVLKPGGTLEIGQLRAWGKERMATYKVPTLLRVVSDLPRNSMGKVQKPEVKKLFSSG